MLTPNDVESKLTQARLDIEARKLTDNQLQAQITQLKADIAALKMVPDVVASAASAGGFNIVKEQTRFLQAVEFVATILVKGIATFNSAVKATVGIVTGLIYPAVNSVTAIKLAKADGTTVILNVDTTNSRVGIVNNAPAYPLDVTGDINASVALRAAGVDIATIYYFAYATATASAQTATIATANLRRSGVVLPVGSYRITYIIDNVSVGATTLTLTLGWTTPRFGVSTRTDIVNNSGTSNFVFAADLDGIADLTYGIVKAGAGTVTYDFRIRIEKI